MAETKRKPARQQGAIPVGGTWEDIFWIQQRADHLRAWGQVYGVVNRAIADRFNRTYPPQRQTAENLVKFARRIRAAKSEWREVARMREAAREAARSKHQVTQTRRVLLKMNEQADRARKQY